MTEKDREYYTKIDFYFKNIFRCTECNWIGITLTDSKEIDQDFGNKKHKKECSDCSQKKVTSMREPFKVVAGDIIDYFEEDTGGPVKK